MNMKMVRLALVSPLLIAGGTVKILAIVAAETAQEVDRKIVGPTMDTVISRCHRFVDEK